MMPSTTESVTEQSLNFENRTLFHSDNLPILRGMNSGTVDLIATDPPFNKNRDFHATPDSVASDARFEDRWRWEEDVHEEWVDAIKDNWPGVWAVIEAARLASGDDMGAFLCWLGVRLMEMHRVLKPTGSLYLHIDHTAHAYVKAMLDGIFGRKQFRNEIVWRIGWVSGYKTQKRGWIRNHDTLLYYTKQQKGFTFNKEYIPYPEGYTRRDGLPGQGKGIPIEDTWNCQPADELNSINIMSFSKEKTGWPTQKPVALYERIIRASSNEGDIVLDPFAGCATTPVAAERQGRRWVAIDIWGEAIKQVRSRIEANKRLQLDSVVEVHYRTDAPVRTDDGEIPAPNLRLRLQRPREPWERLTHASIRLVLEGAQEAGGMVGCAGCGRELESEFMELDHIQPKAENGADHLMNRILLCRPCNGRKSNLLTMGGLRRENNKAGWMKNEDRAEAFQYRALARSTWVRDNWERRAEVGLN